MKFERTSTIKLASG